MGIIDNGYLPDMSAPYYTQDYIPIKKMYDSLIETKDGRFIRIVEILPVNFESKTVSEKDDIIHDFRDWLAISPINIQIKIITEDSDPRKMVGDIMSRYQRDQDYAVEKLVMSYTGLLNSLGSQGAVSKKFYMIIEYEPKATSKKNPEIEDIIIELESAINNIANYFSRMGCSVSLLRDSYNTNSEQMAVMEFLYKLLNPRTSTFDSGRPGVSLQQRIDRVFADKRKITGDMNAQVSVDDVIAPLSMEFTKPDAVVIDGLYYSYMLISGRSYPSLTTAGWFPYYFNLGPGEHVDIFIHKEDRDRLLNMMGQKIKGLGVDIQNRNSFQRGYEDAESALYAAQYMKTTMTVDGEEPFFLTTLLTITGPTYEYIKKRRELFTEFFKTKNMIVDPLTNVQEEAMRSALPFLDLSPKLYYKGKRNILSSGLASCFPFIAADIRDDDGVLMGLDMVNNMPCVLNPFNTKNYTNANMVLLGTSGAGKTYTEQLMALRMRTMGWQCFILAPDKGHEFQRASAFGVQGEYIVIAASSKDHINIMDIRPEVSEAAKMLQGDSAEGTILVSEKASAIITFISLLIPDLTNEEEQTIDTCVMRTYERYGITEDNNSVYIDPEDKSKGLKRMPILSDLYEELERSDVSPRVLKILTQFTTGSAKSFNNRTNVDLTNKYIVFDLSNLKGRLLPAGMFVALDFILGRIKEDVTERKMVFIDEGWQLIGSGANEKAAEYVKTLFKLIRGYNGGACIATQDINDFFSLNDGEYGNAILSNSEIKMLLKLKPKEAEFVRNQLSLTQEEIRNIKNFKRGQCLICAGANHIPVNITGSEYETDLITTDPTRVKKVVKQMSENEGRL